MADIRSDAFVFFGATGDLAYKQIFPALHAMVRRGHLRIPVIGIAAAGWDLEKFKARARDSIISRGNFDAATFDQFASLLRYVDGDYRSAQTFQQLKQALGNAQRPLHYLAIPPSLFGTVADGLASSGCAKSSRVIVEKPFGRDQATARQLNQTLHQFFPEESIYRIDHYLGKEPVLNLIYFRFGNPLIEASWNNGSIGSVQITMAEKFGIGGRGKLYEEIGAIRDVVQNHMLRVITCLAMECPGSDDHAAQCRERSRLLNHVRTLDSSSVVRGQYQGYKQEADVAPDSQVETFAALRFWIDTDRWKDVPFFVRVGKHLPVTATEVLVKSKHSQRPVLDEQEPPVSNHYRFRIGPDMVIAMGARIKKPGECMIGEPVELVAHEQDPDEMKPYDRLLGDAIMGDGTLFAGVEDVEASWRIVEPVLGSATPIHAYQPNTWGPPEADRLSPPGGWHNPEPTPTVN